MRNALIAAARLSKPDVTQCKSDLDECKFIIAMWFASAARASPRSSDESTCTTPGSSNCSIARQDMQLCALTHLENDWLSSVLHLR
jgi:hypothetical protein